MSPSVHEVQVHAFADDAGVLRFDGADQVGSQFQDGVFVEVGFSRSSGNSTR